MRALRAFMLPVERTAANHGSNSEYEEYDWENCLTRLRIVVRKALVAMQILFQMLVEDTKKETHFFSLEINSYKIWFFTKNLLLLL